MRKVRILLSTLAIVVPAGVLVAWIGLPWIERQAATIHQRSVTHSLAVWGSEAAIITNDATARRAAEMLGYIQNYYVPGPGYRGSIEVEAALERQRRESLALVAASLERYTGLNYGTNSLLWTQWADDKKSSETDSSTNRIEPDPRASNSTGVPAASRR